MIVDGVRIEFDVEAYLTKRLGKVDPRRNDVWACCPFHNERTPSFHVDVDSGVFNCFGCGEGGSIAALVKHIERMPTIVDAEQWLIVHYGVLNTVVDEPLELAFETPGPVEAYSIEDWLLEPYMFRHPYLEGRGISDKTQRVFGIGYNREGRSITFPYRDHAGHLVSIKHRALDKKTFWYEPPMPKRIKAGVMFGLNIFLRQAARGLRKLALTEAEIDAMSVYQAEEFGVAAIGGNQFTDELASLLIRVLPSDTELLVFTDNDAGGAVARNGVKEKLGGRFQLSAVSWSLYPEAKDANDVDTACIKQLISSRVEIPLFSI
jgi:DNA primase